MACLTCSGFTFFFFFVLECTTITAQRRDDHLLANILVICMAPPFSDALLFLYYLDFLSLFGTGMKCFDYYLSLSVVQQKLSDNRPIKESGKFLVNFGWNSVGYGCYLCLLF
uniref:Secreted protein n=1 Tax=Anopheles darlingi TaxID=43151 RepID=A0A2M4D3X4_ANODA